MRFSSPGILKLAPDPQLMVARNVENSLERSAGNSQALLYHIQVVRDVSSQQQYITFPGRRLAKFSVVSCT